METQNIQEKFSLRKLLAVIFHVIEKSNDLFKRLYDKNYKLQIFTKAKNEKYTNIDWTIQKIFENHIVHYFKNENLKIIGEEDTKNNIIETYESLEADSCIDLNWDLVDIPLEYQTLRIEDIKIYIDPVDGTNYLIKESYGDCMILIGICFKNKPLIGVVNYPLFGCQKKSVTYFNIPTKGIYEYTSDQKAVCKFEIPKNDSLDIIIREDINIERNKVCKKFKDWNFISARGFGNKAMKCLTINAPYFSNLIGMGPWDTCGVHALSKENNGGLYDLQGKEIEYNDEIDEKGFNYELIFSPGDDKKELFFKYYLND